MKEFSLLIGGKAGDGIKQAGITVSRIFSHLGYRVFLYDDYPSLIRGGHNFCIIRASQHEILSHNEEVDLIVALNQDTIDRHKDILKPKGVILYDASIGEIQGGVGVGFKDIVKEFGGPAIMRNTAAIGALSKLLGIPWDVVEGVIKKSISKKLDLNLSVARKAYGEVDGLFELKGLDRAALPLLTGNEAIALGAVKAGLDLYIAYPMTPATSILHFLAENQQRLGVQTIHPENEISAVMMALGAAYAGKRTAVGTSGGGFALMTEAVSLAGQAEIPILFIECQRAGPSTGVPTYTGQSDLMFVLHSGHGDFSRVVAAPGDAKEAFEWAAICLDAAWCFQIPAFLLSDKHLSESLFAFEFPPMRQIQCKPLLWDGNGEYLRYLDSQTGISPMAFPGMEDCTVKATSYEHDEYGITVEDADKIAFMQNKRLKKEEEIRAFLSEFDTVRVYGEEKSDICLVCWGSTKGACIEAAQKIGAKVVQPILLEPFPEKEFLDAIGDAKRVIGVEVNASGQLSRLVKGCGFHFEANILRYDGRPFTPDGLTKRIEEVL